MHFSNKPVFAMSLLGLAFSAFGLYLLAICVGAFVFRLIGALVALFFIRQGLMLLGISLPMSVIRWTNIRYR